MHPQMRCREVVLLLRLLLRLLHDSPLGFAVVVAHGRAAARRSHPCCSLVSAASGCRAAACPRCCRRRVLVCLVSLPVVRVLALVAIAAIAAVGVVFVFVFVHQGADVPLEVGKIVRLVSCCACRGGACCRRCWEECGGGCYRRRRAAFLLLLLSLSLSLFLSFAFAFARSLARGFNSARVYLLSMSLQDAWICMYLLRFCVLLLLFRSLVCVASGI